MKLTLEELAPYLPYGLRLKCYTDGYPEEIYTMKTLSQEVIVGTGENRLDVEHYHFEDVKPILRPLSDLTKEIEHNGERFVPLKKIALIESPNIVGSEEKIKNLISFNRGLSFDSTQMGVRYEYEGIIIEITHFKDAIFHKQVVKGADCWVYSYFHNYPLIMEKLFEWHFDVFNLIRGGLAVNMNKIKQDK